MSPPSTSAPPAPPPSARVRFPLWVKLALGASLLAVVPVVVVGVRAVGVSAGIIQGDAREYQLAVTRDIGHQTGELLRGAGDALGAVSRALTDPALDEAQRLAVARALVGSSLSLDHVAVYDARGAFIDQIVEDKVALVAPPPTLDAAWRAAADKAGVALGHAEAWEGEVRMGLLAPIRAGERTTGYALTRVSLREIQERVHQLAERDDSLFVVDEALEVVAHPVLERATQLTRVAGQGILSGVSGAVLDEGVAKYGEFVAPDGRAMVGTLAPVGAWPLGVIAQLPREIAYAPVASMRRTVTWAVVLAALAGVVVALAFASRLTAPIRALVGLARELAARRFGARAAVRSSDELALLGAAMNGASDELAASEDRLRHELAIRADLGRYLPAEVVERVVAREQDMALGGQRRAITVVFADVVSFTSMAETLAPEAIVTLLNELFTILTEIVFRHGGIVDKFIGDSMMALWGAPAGQADHAARGVAAALDMQRWLEAGKAAWQERHGVDVRLAIGVNSGEAVVGNVGSDTRMEYTAIGDVVNIAARLESIARPEQILVTRATREAAGAAFEFIPVADRELTGRSGLVEIFEARA